MVVLISQLKSKTTESGGSIFDRFASLTIVELMCSKAISQKKTATSRAPSFVCVFPCGAFCQSAFTG